MRADLGKIELEIYGESHSERIGMILEGIEKGEELDMHCVRDLLARRRAKAAVWSTPRKEEDEPVFVGICEKDGKFVVTADKIEAYILNKNVRSGDYAEVARVPRPSHADLAVWAKEGAIPSGGGRFSGRMTAPLCVAGGIVKELLERRGIFVDAYLSAAAGVRFKSALDDENIALNGLSARDREEIRKNALPTLCADNVERALDKLKEIAADGDSAGGVVECVISGLKTGEIGDALFDGVEGRIAYALYAIPAVKGVEFGGGYALADMRGSEANDPIGIVGGAPLPLGNMSGGINGGISNGRPIIVRAAIKPTPSISKAQKSVRLEDMTECETRITGRHDACIAPRAVPAVEAACALAIFGML